MEFALIFVVIAAIIGLIVLIRILANVGRVAKAKKLVEAGEKGKALELFLKVLKFQIGNKKAYEVLGNILDLYRAEGYGDAEIQKMKDTYSVIHDEFNDELEELDKIKMKDKKRIDAINALDKDSKERFDKEFVPGLPKLN